MHHAVHEQLMFSNKIREIFLYLRKIKMKEIINPETVSVLRHPYIVKRSL